MIETVHDLTKFEEENLNGDLFLHLIPVDENVHPCQFHKSLLFIRNLLTERTYCYSFDHPDFLSKVDGNLFNNVLSQMKNKKWAIDSKAFRQSMPIPNLYDLNFLSHINYNEIFNLSDYETTAHFIIRKSVGHRKGLNLVIPYLKHKEVFDLLCKDVSSLLNTTKQDDAFHQFNTLIIETLGLLEEQGIYVNQELFLNKFGIDVGAEGLVYSQYNPYTSTGRPSNRFNNINYAALNVEDGTRKCFQSRYGNDGKMVVIDYTTFHPRLVCELTNHKIPIDIDIYEYLAKLYFQKKDVDETDVKQAKQLTFKQFFGGVESRYSHIKYLANLKTFVDSCWDHFTKYGYVTTPYFQRILSEKHISDPNPPKVFNYILQAAEGEVAIPRLKLVLEYLKTKKTRAVLYTYDAVLYDFHREDGYNTLKEIRSIMNSEGKFPMKTYIGDTYHDTKLISI